MLLFKHSWRNQLLHLSLNLTSRSIWVWLPIERTNLGLLGHLWVINLPFLVNSNLRYIDVQLRIIVSFFDRRSLTLFGWFYWLFGVFELSGANHLRCHKLLLNRRIFIRLDDFVELSFNVHKRILKLVLVPRWPIDVAILEFSALEFLLILTIVVFGVIKASIFSILFNLVQNIDAFSDRLQSILLTVLLPRGFLDNVSLVLDWFLLVVIFSPVVIFVHNRVLALFFRVVEIVLEGYMVFSLFLYVIDAIGSIRAVTTIIRNEVVRVDIFVELSILGVVGYFRQVTD